MRRLFMLECKKIAASAIYWLFAAAIIVVFWFNYGNVDEEQIRNASDPSSLFYSARDGQYRSERAHV